MKWIPFVILACMMLLWVLQFLLRASAQRDEQFLALHRERVAEALRRKAS